MRIPMNEYEKLMKEAADKLREEQDKVSALTKQRDALLEAAEAAIEALRVARPLDARTDKHRVSGSILTAAQRKLHEAVAAARGGQQ